MDRSAFDRIVQAGGYISVRTGAAPDAHAVGVNKAAADRAFDAATCTSCHSASARRFLRSDATCARSCLAPARACQVAAPRERLERFSRRLRAQRAAARRGFGQRIVLHL